LISVLKLRASYGKAGNNRISDNAWRKNFSVGYSSLYMGSDQTAKTAVLLASNILSNENLKWETTLTRNLGIDFGLFNHRVSGNIDVYSNTTSDLLIQALLPPSSGYIYQWQNIGQTSNKGLEVKLDGVLVDRKDFKLSVSFNIGFNKSRIDQLGETKSWLESSRLLPITMGGSASIEDFIIEEGGQVGQMYGYVQEGMYSFDDFDYNQETGVYTLKEGIPDNSALIGATSNGQWIGPGMLKLKDLNGDGIVDENDKTTIGNANPKHTGGFTLTAQWKGLDFSAFFNWVYGNSIYNANKINYTSNYAGYPYRNIMNIMNSDNRFMTISKQTGKKVTDPVELAAINANATIWSPLYTTPRLTDWFIEDGSFLRLNNVTIGYTLPKEILSKIGISQLRVYATGYNLWTWTNYSGFDPEVSTVRGTPLTPGVDWQAYPKSRSFNVGLNIEF
jgi:TonB-linked SusC/RagA family outer membrane protein